MCGCWRTAISEPEISCTWSSFEGSQMTHKDLHIHSNKHNLYKTIQIQLQSNIFLFPFDQQPYHRIHKRPQILIRSHYYLHIIRHVKKGHLQERPTQNKYRVEQTLSSIIFIKQSHKKQEISTIRKPLLEISYAALETILCEGYQILVPPHDYHPPDQQNGTF